MLEQKRKYDLEERLIEFAVMIIKISESLFPTRAGIHIAGQLVRSGTSPALHYGEAQSAESRADFIHKIKIVLKELRESSNALKIISKVPLIENLKNVEMALDECNQLIAIFVKSLETAKNNLLTKQKLKKSKKNTE